MESLGGSRSAIIITDNFTHMRWVFFCKSKNEHAETLLCWARQVQTETGQTIGEIKADGEFRSKQLDDWCSQNGTSLTIVAPYSPEQNGKAERSVGLMKNMARTIMLDANLPPTWWAEALSCAAYTMNRLPTVSNVGDRSPYEVWSGMKPDLRRMRVFGSKALVLVTKESGRHTWDSHAKELIFVGYQKGTKNWKFLPIRGRGRPVYSSSAKFIEDEIHENDVDSDQSVDDEGDSIRKIVQPDIINVKANMPDYVQAQPVDENTYGDNYKCFSGGSAQNNEQTIPVSPVTLRRSNRLRGLEPAMADCTVTQCHGFRRKALDVQIPKSLEEALSGLGAKLWKEALSSEYQSLVRKGTFRVVPRPNDQNVIGSRWVFSVKSDKDGFVEKF